MSGAAHDTAADRARRWSEQLMEELLPRQPRPGIRVLLACDDETIRRVGMRLGHGGAMAADRFAGDVRVAFQIDARTGIGRANASRFVALRERPRPAPEFFPVLCLLVLAASRMEPHEDRPTHAYYARLRALLGIGGDGEIPDIEFVGRLFGCLAEWLDDDLKGERGRLVLPSSPVPPHVGTIVSQTVFRRRDRQVLAEFFSSRYFVGQSGEASFQDADPLRRLRRWPGRSELTQHALRVLGNDSVADQVRAAIRAAYQSWDGSLPTEEPAGFVRRWPGRLRLLTNPLRLRLGADNTETIELPTKGRPYRLEPGTEASIGFPFFNSLRDKPRTLGRPSSPAGVVWFPKLGDTVMFELGDDGLLRVDRPTEPEVWVLTCDGALLSRLAAYRVSEDVLPQPWQLLRRVPVDLLGGVTPDEPGRADDFWLEGGLPLGRRRYLSGSEFGPDLVAGEVDVDAQLLVHVNGTPWAAITPGARVALPGEPGSYAVTVGDDEWRTSYAVEERGEPEAPGTLAHQLDAPDALRAGARPVTGEVGGVTVSGADVSLPDPHAPPILKRGANDLWTIDHAGAHERHSRPPDPTWLQQVGLGDHVRPRWEINRDGVVWLLDPDAPGRPRAELQRAVMLGRLSPEAATVVERMNRRGRPTLSARRGSGLSPTLVAATWNSLVRRAVFTLSGTGGGRRERP